MDGDQVGRYLDGDTVVLADGGKEQYTDGGTVDPEGRSSRMIDRRTAIAGGAGAALALLGVGAYTATQSGNDAPTGRAGQQADGGANSGAVTTVETPTAPATDTPSPTATDQSTQGPTTTATASGDWIPLDRERDIYYKGNFPLRQERMQASSADELVALLKDREPGEGSYTITVEPFGLRQGDEEYVVKPIVAGSGYGGGAGSDIFSYRLGHTNSDWGASAITMFPPYEELFADLTLPKVPYLYLGQAPVDIGVVDGTLGGEFEFVGTSQELIEKYDIEST